MKQEAPQVIIISDTEKSMVKMLADGMQGKQMAKELKTLESTLAFNLSELRKKLGCKNSINLVAYFFRNKLID